MSIRYAEQSSFLQQVNGQQVPNIGTPMASGFAPFYNPNPINVDKVHEATPGGQKRSRTDYGEEEEARVSKRSRRHNETNINSDQIALVSKIGQDPIVNSGIESLLTMVFEGGVDVAIGGVLSYPGYDKDIEETLVDECKRALRRMLELGFVAVHTGLYTPRYRREKMIESGCISTYSSDESSECDGIFSPIHGSTLLFKVPSENIGQFKVYFDTGDYRRKVDFIKTWSDQDDEIRKMHMERERLNGGGDSLALEDDIDESNFPSWSVYINKEPNGDGSLFSPLSSIITDYEKYNRAKSYDDDATFMATHPLVITQERPPQKESSIQRTPFEAAREYASEGERRTGDGFGQSKGTPRARGIPAPRQPIPVANRGPYGPPPNEAGTATAMHKLYMTQAISADFYSRSTVDIGEGRIFAGLLTPHAYPSVAQRTQEWLHAISVAIALPMHVLQPSSSSLSSGSSISGAVAGQKRPTSSGARQSKGDPSSSSGHRAPQGYTGDPAYVTAMNWRHIISKFFKTIMEVTHGPMVLNAYVRWLKRTESKELETRDKIVADLEARIEQARKDVIAFDPQKDREDRERNDIEKTQQAINGAQPPTPVGGGEGGPAKAPAAPINLPEPSAAKFNGKIPTAESVSELQKRLLELNLDLRKIREALSHIEKLKSDKLSVELTFRLPIFTDTSNPSVIIDALGEQPETSIAVGRARAGLTGLV